MLELFDATLDCTRADWVAFFGKGLVLHLSLVGMKVTRVLGKISGVKS